MPRLVQAGKRVALAEGGRFGGSCVNYGCTPTKTIVASARAAHMARRGPDFGVITGEISLDFTRSTMFRATRDATRKFAPKSERTRANQMH